VLQVSDAYLYSITALRLHNANTSSTTTRSSASSSNMYSSTSANNDDDTLAVADDNGSVHIISLQHGLLHTIDTPLRKSKTVWSVCAIDDNR
jgi:hypothetical protein